VCQVSSPAAILTARGFYSALHESWAYCVNRCEQYFCRITISLFKMSVLFPRSVGQPQLCIDISRAQRANRSRAFLFPCLVWQSQLCIFPPRLQRRPQLGIFCSRALWAIAAVHFPTRSGDSSSAWLLRVPAHCVACIFRNWKFRAIAQFTVNSLQCLYVFQKKMLA